MIIIIAIIYMFYLMWYLISNRKLLSENPQGPPEKIHSPHFTHSSPLKFQKVQVPSFLPTLKFLPKKCPKITLNLTLITCGNKFQMAEIVKAFRGKLLRGVAFSHRKSIFSSEGHLNKSAWINPWVYIVGLSNIFFVKRVSRKKLTLSVKKLRRK